MDNKEKSCCGENHHHEHKNGCCGHEHNHEHGHNHEHKKDSCCGDGHGHKHNHNHEHGECCGDGHVHDHSHDHGDCCGHGHGHEHGDCCGHDHEHHHTQMMTLVFDDEKEVNCAVLALFEFEGDNYIILLPEGSDEYLVYRYVEEGESFSLENIESKEKFDKVIEYINSDDFE